MFSRVTPTAFFCGPGYWHLVFPSNTDTHLLKSIDAPIMTDSFGGKTSLHANWNKFGGEPRLGEKAGRMKWWDRIL